MFGVASGRNPTTCSATASGRQPGDQGDEDDRRTNAAEDDGRVEEEPASSMKSAATRLHMTSRCATAHATTEGRTCLNEWRAKRARQHGEETAGRCSVARGSWMAFRKDAGEFLVTGYKVSRVIGH